MSKCWRLIGPLILLPSGSMTSNHLNLVDLVDTPTDLNLLCASVTSAAFRSRRRVSFVSRGCTRFTRRELNRLVIEQTAARVGRNRLGPSAEGRQWVSCWQLQRRSR